MTRRRRPYRLSGWLLLTSLRARAYRKQKGLCYWCHRKMTLKDKDDPLLCTADHVIPVYAGGETKAGNIVAACRECNGKRNPETNRLRKGTRITSGDDSPRSPFDVLNKIKE